jgi:hypothetical protein
MSSESDAKNPLRAFTQPARVLVVISMLFGGVVFYLSVDRQIFSPGFYPLVVLLLPGFGGALALFCVGCIAFRLLGIKVWAAPVTDCRASDEEAPKSFGSQPPDAPDE